MDMMFKKGGDNDKLKLSLTQNMGMSRAGGGGF